MSGLAIYRGHADGRTVTVTYAEGTVPLPHIVHHSPTGMTWGYGGSGPADLARSLLVHALGAEARCTDCDGTGQIVVDGEQERCRNCMQGVPHTLPYQEFKFEVVARLGESWTLATADIVGWYRAQEAYLRPLDADEQRLVDMLAALDEPRRRRVFDETRKAYTRPGQ